MMEERIVSRMLKGVHSDYDVIWLPTVIWDMFVILKETKYMGLYGVFDESDPKYMDEFSDYVHANFKSLLQQLHFSAEKPLDIIGHAKNLYLTIDDNMSDEWILFN